MVILFNGSGGIAQVYKTSNTGCEVHSTSNRMLVEGFTSNYCANIAAADSIMSHFNDIVAVQEKTGAGAFYAVHSCSDGDLYVTNDIVVDRNIGVGGTLELATGTTVNEIAVSLASSSDNILLTEKAIEDYITTQLGDYINKDGSVAFTSPVASATPTLGAHLTTKDYVDGVAGGGGLNDLGPFVDKDLVTPPGGETLANKYVIAGIGGAWAGFAINDVVTVSGVGPTAWTNETPVAGKHGWVTDEGIDYTFNGAVWVATGTLIDHTTIQNIGVKTHAQIDTHVNNVTTNPHAVTKTNISLGSVTDDAQLKRSANDFSNGIAVKADPADNDRFLIEDSDDALNKKYILSSNLFDKKLKISSNDTTQDYLINKLIGTANKITLTEIGDGGDEDLQIDIGSDLTNTITKVHDESHTVASHSDTTATGAELETLTDGSNADTLHVHLSGWYGSDTRIKIAPAEFVPNDSKEWKQVIENDGGSVVDSEGKITELITVPIYIPTGYKATAYMVYSSANIAIEIFEDNIANSSATSKGSGNANTEVNMTDVDTSVTNYLSIVVVDAGADVYGAYVTIAKI